MSKKQKESENAFDFHMEYIAGAISSRVGKIKYGLIDSNEETAKTVNLVVALECGMKMNMLLSGLNASVLSASSELDPEDVFSISSMRTASVSIVVFLLKKELKDAHLYIKEIHRVLAQNGTLYLVLQRETHNLMVQGDMEKRGFYGCLLSKSDSSFLYKFEFKNFEEELNKPLLF